MSIVLIGAGGHAKVILDTAKSINKKIVGFIDDNVEEFFGLTKLYDKDLFQNKNKLSAIIAFGAVKVDEAKRRNDVFSKYKGINFTTLIHRQAIVSTKAKIGKGVVIFPGAIINAGAIIDDNAIINSAAIIEHDATIGKGTHICPGAIVLGGASVAKNSIVGAGAVILPYSEILTPKLIYALTRYPK